MNTNELTPIIWWKIRCFNRVKKSFFDRFLLLDWSTLSSEQKIHVSMLRGTDSAIEQYRTFFREVEPAEIRDPLPGFRGMQSFFLPGHFEDEDGEAMDEIGLAQALTGEEHPILLGSPVSVLRIGPTGVRNKGEWTAKVANDIEHFLTTVRHIERSSWLSSGLSMSFTASRGDINGFPKIDKITDFESPNADATRGVIMAIRQLVSKDDTFNVACNLYQKHSLDERKRIWVREHKRMFNARRLAPPPFLGIETITTHELTDIFIYGSGWVHRNSDSVSEDQLRQLFDQFGPERVIMAINLACRTICEHALYVYHVVDQDFQYWIRYQDCCGPSRVDVDSLLG